MSGPAGERGPITAGVDVVVVGGGIHGAAAARTLAEAGASVVLAESGDLGGGATWNSLRILHGGLRYLQSMDLPRFRESVAARREPLRTAPDAVEPLACLMPLDGRGLRRKLPIRAALMLNDLLSARRNDGVRADRHLPGGRVLGRRAATCLWKPAGGRGGGGAALWHDARMRAPQRLLLAHVHAAAAAGVHVVNRTRVVPGGIGTSRAGGTERVVCVRLEGPDHGVTLPCRAVLDCAGGASGLIAGGAPVQPPSLAFNLLLDRPAPWDGALAAIDSAPGGQVLFMHPVRGRLLAGTWHAPWTQPEAPAELPGELRDAFLAALGRAVPGLDPEPRHVLRELIGILPASAAGTADLAARPRFVDHAESGGPEGAFSLSGIKWTTAPQVAAQAARQVAARLGRGGGPGGGGAKPRPGRAASTFLVRTEIDGIDLVDPAGLLAAPDAQARLVLEQLAGEFSADGPGDILLRRTDWGFDPVAAGPVIDRMATLLDWSAERAAAERTAAGSGPVQPSSRPAATPARDTPAT